MATMTEWTLPMNGQHNQRRLSWLSEERTDRRVFYTKLSPISIIGMLHLAPQAPGSANCIEWAAPYSDVWGVACTNVTHLVWFTSPNTATVWSLDLSTGSAQPYFGPFHGCRAICLDHVGLPWVGGVYIDQRKRNGVPRLSHLLDATTGLTEYWDLPSQFQEPLAIWAEADGTHVWIAPAAPGGVSPTQPAKSALVGRLNVKSGGLTAWVTNTGPSASDSRGVWGDRPVAPQRVWACDATDLYRIDTASIPPGAGTQTLERYHAPSNPLGGLCVVPSGDVWAGVMGGDLLSVPATQKCGTAAATILSLDASRQTMNAFVDAPVTLQPAPASITPNPSTTLTLPSPSSCYVTVNLPSGAGVGCVRPSTTGQAKRVCWTDQNRNSVFALDY